MACIVVARALGLTVTHMYRGLQHVVFLVHQCRWGYTYACLNIPYRLQLHLAKPVSDSASGGQKSALLVYPQLQHRQYACRRGTVPP